MGQSELRKNAVSELLSKVLDCFRLIVKCWHCRHYGRPRVVHAKHIFEVNTIQRRFAQTKDQRAALFEANIRRASEQVARCAHSD